MFQMIRRFTGRADARSDSGQTLVEYALILMFVALLTVTALQTIGVSITQFISDAATGVGGG